jgi:hypothetical protein
VIFLALGHWSSGAGSLVIKPKLGTTNLASTTTKVLSSGNGDFVCEIDIQANNSTADQDTTVHFTKSESGGGGSTDAALSTFQINGGVANVGATAQRSPLSYVQQSGHNQGFVCPFDGELYAMSIILKTGQSRSSGTCEGRTIINGTPEATNVVTIDATNTSDHYAVFGTPTSISAGDIITLETNTTGYAPTGDDANISAFIREKVSISGASDTANIVENAASTIDCDLSHELDVTFESTNGTNLTCTIHSVEGRWS